MSDGADELMRCKVIWCIVQPAANPARLYQPAREFRIVHCACCFQIADRKSRVTFHVPRDLLISALSAFVIIACQATGLTHKFYVAARF